MAGDQSSLAACSSPAARPRPAASRALSRCQWASRRALALSVAMKLLVAATLRSLPAQSGTTNSLAASSGESSAFTRAMPRAPRSRRMRRLSTRSGLCPDCESEDGLPGDTQRRAVQGHHRHGQRGHRQAGVLHGQVGEVAGGMVGAAARDSQCQVRIDLPQTLAKRRQAGVEHGQLTARHRGGGERFLEHQRSHSSSPSTITASSSRERSRRTTSAQAAGARRPRSARPR